jgi:hypothetical protein
MAQILDELEPQYEGILIYSDPGEGKTRLATSLTERFGETIYACADEKSEKLDPVLHRYRKRIHRWKPEAGKDVIAEYWDLLIKAKDGTWAREFPDAKTIAIDSGTAMGLSWLYHIANTGQFTQTGHIRIGPRGDDAGYNIPIPADYGAAQRALDRWVTFALNLPYHFIFICHADFDEPQEGGPAEFGPKTVGKATVRTLAGKFPMVVRVASRTTGGGPGKDARQEVTAYTQRQGMWNAKLRSGHEINPIPKVKLDADPINFWKEYEEKVVNYG